MVRPAAPNGTPKEVCRNRRAGKEVLSGCVGNGPTTSAVPRGQTLHTLEVEAVLLEVTGDVLPGEAVDAHKLHDCLGDGVLDAEVGDGVDESLVELRGPDEARALEGTGRLVAVAGGVGEVGGGGGEVVGRGRGEGTGGDVEG